MVPALAPRERVRAGALPSLGPRRVLDGYGRAVASAASWSEPGTVEELVAALERAREEGLPVAMRGSGRSYGDASMNQAGLVLSTRGLGGVRSFDEALGVADCGPGATIEDLWRAGLPRGFWPAVVPGTQHPTLAGCVSMNIHGKNHFRTGPFGEHVRELDLWTPAEGLKTVGPEQEPEVFDAVVGGLGLLGVVTRLAVELKPVTSGYLEVEGLSVPSLGALFDAFEARLDDADYLVGWVDLFPRGRSLGRSVIHRAWYLPGERDPHGTTSLTLDHQELPERFFGVLPRGLMWRLLRPFVNDLGMRLVNHAKYTASRLFDRPHKRFLQSQVAFAFLLDYVPRWRDAYGRGGFIQVQPFVPHETAREAMAAIISACHRYDIVPYLGVFKRHRPDRFLLSHALDGWSLAMDIRITRRNRERVWALGREIGDITCDHGGRCYFAKDALAMPEHVQRGYGAEALERFAAMKRRLDPDGLLSTELSRRVLPDLPVLDRGLPAPRTSG